jgi:hypothetical protein
MRQAVLQPEPDAVGGLDVEAGRSFIPDGRAAVDRTDVRGPD